MSEHSTRAGDSTSAAMMPRGVRRLVMLALGTLIVGALVLVAVRGEAMLLDLTAAIAAFCL